MDLQELRQEAIKIIKANPELKSEIQDLFSLAISEVEEGGSESHECDLAYNDMIELQNEANNNKMVKGGKLTGSQQAKFDKVMSEWKAGKLHSGSSDGPIVKDQDQAIAIAYAQANGMKKMEFGGLVYDSLSDEAKDRMDGLVPTEQINDVLSNCRYIVSQMMEEGFELDEAISFIVYKIVDDFTDKRMGYFSDEYYPEDWKETGGSVEDNQIEEYAEAIYQDLRQEYKPWELQNMSTEEAMMSVDSYDEVPENLKEEVASYLMNMASQNEFFEEDEEDEEYKDGGSMYNKGGVIENKMQSLENELKGLESELKWTQQQNGASKQYYLRKRRSGKMTRERAMELIDQSNASWKKEREKVREKIKEVKDRIKRLEELSSKVNADQFAYGGGVGEVKGKQPMKNLEFSSKRVSYAHQIAKSGKRPTDEQVKQAYLSNIEDGRFLENVQKNWDKKMETGGAVDDVKKYEIIDSNSSKESLNNILDAIHLVSSKGLDLKLIDKTGHYAGGYNHINSVYVNSSMDFSDLVRKFKSILRENGIYNFTIIEVIKNGSSSMSKGGGVSGIKIGDKVKVVYANEYNSEKYKIGDVFEVRHISETGSDNSFYVSEDINYKFHPSDVKLIKTMATGSKMNG